MSGALMAMKPAPNMAQMAIQYAPSSPTKWISAAPAKGPMKVPMRVVPPSVDRARARYVIGTTSIM
ncbi:hypothetical protein D3C81_2125970 [compost metagenome]